VDKVLQLGWEFSGVAYRIELLLNDGRALMTCDCDNTCITGYISLDDQ
jgi:hypothetical protein